MAGSLMSTLPTRDLHRSLRGARSPWHSRAFQTGVFGAAFFLFYSLGSYLWSRPAFHKELINKYSVQYHVDPLWVMAVIQAESGFAPWARSSRGAMGLMQMLPTTARELAPEVGLKKFRDQDLKDPDVNLRLGVYYLWKLRTMYPDDETAVLAAYNAGPGVTQNWKRGKPVLEVDDIPYSETRSYVSRVQRTYQMLKVFQRWKRFFGVDLGR